MERSESNFWKRGHDKAGFAASLGALVLLSCCLVFPQVQNPGLTSLPSAEQVIQRQQDPFSGSLPQGKAAAGVIDLSIEDALDRGLKYNLGLYLSDRATDQTRAARLRALSELLPVVNGGFSGEETRINLKAFGLTFPGFPSSVGPFSLTELQATGSWDPLNLHYISGVHAATQNVKAAEFSYRDARDTVVLAVGANYLLTIAHESRVEATEAELKAAQALYQLAVDQENAGIAPEIDTLRARVQLQTQQSALIQAQNDLEKQRIALARVIGLPVQQKFRLVNRVPYQPLPEAETANAYERALQTRPDYQAALASLRAAQYSLDAAWQQRLPSIGFAGNYGVLGFNPASLGPNWTAAATLAIPIFQGGKVESDIQQARAVLKQRQAQVDNLRGSIEQDIENSLLDLRAAAEQVEVAKTGLDYAQRTLEQSQDRFAAGVTNNVEVIQAQQQLASANEQYIASLYGHNIAKVLLARAIGNAEQAVKQYLSQPGSVVPVNPATPPNPAPPPAAPQTVPQGPSGNVGELRAMRPQPEWKAASGIAVARPEQDTAGQATGGQQ
ncbi:MAG TPA: TolC family protein [Candidatus Binatia bacterium]|nr:TolC family protein [Candidatus Binatia bacterium]